MRRALALSALLALAACSAEDASSPSASSGSGGASGSSSGGGGSTDGGATTDGSSSSDGGSGGGVDGVAPSTKGSGGNGGLVGASVTLAGCGECRVHVPPSYDASKPTPLLVFMHGDEGPSTGVTNVIDLWSAAADAHGYLVLAIPCSAELDCADGNWSNWLAGQSYQLTAQHMTKMNGWTTAMESLYDVALDREYVGGYSGGAYVLGYFAQAQADRYAGAAFVAGGMPAWTGTGHACPTKKIPGYFLGGDGDPRTGGQMSDTASSFQTCGQELTLDLVKGADHGQTIASLGTGRAAAILTWFDARPLK